MIFKQVAASFTVRVIVGAVLEPPCWDFHLRGCPKLGLNV